MNPTHYPLLNQNRTPDKRYTVTRENCGGRKCQAVVRYEGNFVIAVDDIDEASYQAYHHDEIRCGVSRPLDLLRLEPLSTPRQSIPRDWAIKARYAPQKRVARQIGAFLLKLLILAGVLFAGYLWMFIGAAW